MLRAFVVAAVLALAVSDASAHKASDGYLSIEHRASALDVRLDLALRDLDNALGLDEDGDGAITWGELRRRNAAIAAYVQGRLSIAAGGEACSLTARSHAVDSHSDGAYAVLHLDGRCADDAPVLTVDYRLLFDVDAMHRGLVQYVGPDGQAKSLVLSASSPRASLSPATSTAAQALAYVSQGVHHIVAGFDHLLFLVSLLLPAVLVWGGREWSPAASFRSCTIDAAKIVTAFTVAHSLTLGIAVLGIVSLPPRFVESAIAVSVVVAALNNLRPVVLRARALAAFGFGLVHGFGFAGALGDLGLPDGALLLSLASFNVGVEVGQLAIVAVFLPAAFALRATTLYRSVVVKAGSSAIAVVALMWFVERAFGGYPDAVAALLPR
jgi:hypothetical protein